MTCHFCIFACILVLLQKHDLKFYLHIVILPSLVEWTPFGVYWQSRPSFIYEPNHRRPYFGFSPLCPLLGIENRSQHH